MAYTLEDCKLDGDPQFKKVLDKNVDPDIAYGCETGMLQGEINSSVTYSGTIFITGDLLVKNAGTKLSLDQATAIISEGVKIICEPGTSIEIKKSVLAPCRGTWEGIEIKGTSGNESVLIEDSYIYGAVVPITAKKIMNVSIKRNIMANGESAVILDSCAANGGNFMIEQNAFAGYKNTVKTSHSFASPSTIKQNHILYQSLTAISFDSDDHSQLDLSCNIIADWSEAGVKSRSTILNDIGNSVMSGGNVFQRMGGTPSSFIDHSAGNSPNYFAGPFETMLYAGYNTMNINQMPAQMDNLCAVSVVASYICKAMSVVGINDQGAQMEKFLTIFPNPSSGNFTLKYEGTGIHKLTVYDMMGRLVLAEDIDFSNDTAKSFNLTTRGLYVVCLDGEKTRFTQKIIVE